MKPRVTASANQRRAFWRSFRLSLGWLWWQAYVLSHLGLLDRPGRASRWLSVRMSQLEHGLRCLLIIGCQALPRTAPPAALAPSSASPTQPAPPNPADAQLPDLDLPACELDMPGKARQLGLSLCGRISWVCRCAAGGWARCACGTEPAGLVRQIKFHMKSV